jgi:YebC/PmpR family DNA-binding regulatory protein
MVIEKARSANMPKENIERGIKKGLGATEGEAYEEVVYEGYGPGGTAIYLETLTDNRNRTVGEVRHILTKNGGNLGASGCVAYLFEKRGMLSFEREGVDVDALMEAALEAGANDVEESEDAIDVVTEPGLFESVQQALEGQDFRSVHAEVIMQPSTVVKLEGKDAETMLLVADALEELDDVQNVYANFDISEEEMARIAG